MICSSFVCVATGIDVILATAAMSVSGAVTLVRILRGRVLLRNSLMIPEGSRVIPDFRLLQQTLVGTR